MDFVIFQHVPYENPGYILDWIRTFGHKYREVNFYDHPVLPEMKDFENLVAMGGPMNIYDNATYPWLAVERELIRKALRSGVKVLGICLGAQFIADALGAQVVKNKYLEVGWNEVVVDEHFLPKKYQGVFPNSFKTLHWHGDTFSLPAGTKSFISSKATANQAFVSENAAAFQFHMEMTPQGIVALQEQNWSLFENDQPFIQKPCEMYCATDNHEINQKILFRFLDRFFNNS